MSENHQCKKATEGVSRQGKRTTNASLRQFFQGLPTFPHHILNTLGDNLLKPCGNRKETQKLHLPTSTAPDQGGILEDSRVYDSQQAFSVTQWGNCANDKAGQLLHKARPGEGNLVLSRTKKRRMNEWKEGRKEGGGGGRATFSS